MRKLWLLILSCATLLGLIYSARSVYITLSQGRTVDWLRLIVFEFQYWYVWAVLTPGHRCRDVQQLRHLFTQQELDFLRGYLEIEQTRFQDRLTVRFDVSTAALFAQVPNLILQPLVENAIRHGVTTRPGAGVIEINASVENQRLQMQVSDDGPGLDDTFKIGG